MRNARDQHAERRRFFLMPDLILLVADALQHGIEMVNKRLYFLVLIR